MAEENTCPDCGAPITGAGLAGQCPECLLKLGLGNLFTAEVATDASGSDAGAFLEGTQFGDYDLLAQIARGGMGVVFHARQRSLNRDVAIKMILSGRFASPDELRRFRIEAEAAALLDHPNIVPIYDVGLHEDTPYLTMALIDGQSLAARIFNAEFKIPTDRPQEARERQKKIASLVRTLAIAAHHAHQRGVIHRDLKPANILFDADRQPRIADFGLAHQIDSETLRTASSQLAGTPAYMAPEQARLNSSELTTSVDVYALGAILFELLTGRPPFLGGTPLETLHKLLEEEPIDPRAVNPLVDSDLAVICLKCLEKEPARRYESAAALADELQRWIDGRPIEARPTAQITRLIKWSRRRPAIASLSLFSIVALVAFIILLIVSRHRIEERRQFAVQQKQLAEAATAREQQEKDRLNELLNRLDFNHAETLLEKGRTSESFAYLARLVRKSPTNSAFSHRLFNALLRDVSAVPVMPAWKQKGGANRIAFSPDGSRIATAGVHGNVAMRRTATGRTDFTTLAHTDLITVVRFNADGTLLLTASKDGTAKIWSADTGDLVATLDLEAAVSDAVFSPDGTTLVTASADRRICRWSSKDGALIETYWHSAPVQVVRFSPNGSQLAGGAKDGSVKLWRPGSQNPLIRNFSIPGAVNDLDFGPRGGRLAAASSANAVHVWNLQNGSEVCPPLVHDGGVTSLAFSTTGAFLATASIDKLARVWRIPGAKLAFPPILHDSELHGVEFSADDSLLMTTSWGRTAQIWNTADGAPASQELAHADWVRIARFSPDGNFVATASADRSTQLWKLLKADARVLRHSGAVLKVSIDPSSGMVASIGRFSGVRLWNGDGSGPATLFDSKDPPTSSLAFSPDATRLAVGFRTGGVGIRDLPGHEAHPLPTGETTSANTIAFSPDGKLLAAGYQSGSLKIWSQSAPFEQILDFNLEQPVTHLKFSPDGERLFACAAGVVRLAVVALSDEPVVRAFYPPTPARVRSLMFHPGSQRVVIGCSDRRARIFDAAYGNLISDAFQHDDQVYAAIYSPDGARIATVSKDRSARIWNADTGALIGRPFLHESPVHTAAFNADSSLLATGTLDGVARIWNVESGLPIFVLRIHDQRINQIAFIENDRRLLTASLDGAIIVTPLLAPPTEDIKWLPDLAEAIGGLRLDDDRLLQVVARTNYWPALDAALYSRFSHAFEAWRPASFPQ